MLKNLLPLLLLICFTVSAQTTPIPDANFEQFLVDQGIDTNGVSGNILDVDAQAVTNLNVTRNDITDFTGLEAFVNIVTLNTGGNQYPTIPLNTLTLLESFVFNRNQDLDSIDFTQNPALRSINIRSHNQPELSITTLDLSQNLNLESVTIELPSLTSLTFPITTTLVDIDTYNCSVPVIDLSQLEGDLDYYIIGSHVDVTIVYPNKRDALKILRLSSIDFPTVDVSEMIGLERLSLSSTDVETLLLPSTTTLTNLSVSHHDFGSSLDLSPVPALTSLDIRFADSPLDIDLTSSPLLRDVWLTHNMMTTVDVTQNPALYSFRIYDNELPSLDVSQNLDLYRLDAGQNLLPSIDLSQNLQLEYLRLPENQLPNLDVTNNTELRIIDIGENLFTGSGLDLTQNPQLIQLFADNNQIESLDISQNADLNYMDISYNLFPGNDILNQFATLVSTYGRLRGALIANNNLLSGPLPDFFGLYDPAVQTRRFRLHFGENRFHFGDFEDQHLDLFGLTTTMSIGPSPDWVIDQYTYAPQAKVNTIDNPSRNAGESITLTTTVRGSQNHYKWFKDGVEITDAPDAPEFTISDLNTCDAGVYHAEITSDLVPFEDANPPGTNGRNLLLVRNDISLTVNATKECVNLDMPLTNVPINSGVQWNDTPGACGYKISLGTSSGSDDLLPLTDVGEATVYNHPTDFASNQDIFVTIIPYYDDGDFSCAEQSFRTNNTTVEPECTFLSSPLDLSVNVPFDLDRLEWNPANGADEYNITITSPSGSNDIITNTTDTFLTLSNDFDEGEVVTVTIVPENSVGMASGCASESFTIQNSGGPTPPSCTNLNNPTDTATDVAVDLTSISWDAAANATQYRITIDGSTSNLNDETDLIVTGTSHSFANDFDNGETVTVTIVPLNGTVEPSTTCSAETFTIISAGPTPPSCTSLNSPTDSATDVAVDLASISWDAAANATQYRITIDGSTSDANDEADLIVSGTSHSFTNDFDNGETVTVTIIPLNGTVEPNTACSAETFTIISAGPTPPSCTSLNSPTDSATDVAVDLASISWDAAANATQYRITIDGSTSDANDEADLIVSGTSHSFTNDFDNGETVTVTIIPLNGTVEPNTACSAETFTIISAGPTPPSCTSLNSPTDSATDVAVDLASISWDAAANATQYRITIDGSTSDANDEADLIVSGTSHSFADNFDNGETVTVTIVPLNGTVEPSTTCSSETFTIISAGPTPPSCTNLNSPTGSATDVAVDLASITWDVATNATQYRITIDGSTSEVNDETDLIVTGTSHSFANDFDNGETVTVTIVPLNGTVEPSAACSSETFTIVSSGSTPPSCTNLNSPTDTATDVAVNSQIEWDAVTDADGYYLSLGTESGNYNLLSNEDVGILTSYSLNEDFGFNTTIYVLVVPYSTTLGEAENCDESSFTTIQEPIVEVDDETKYGFSPDGDGINEYWHIDNIENHPQNMVTIYNRWGDAIFKIENYDNGALVFSGNANLKTKMGAGRLPAGTYFFDIQFEGESTLRKTKGYLVIKR